MSHRVCTIGAAIRFQAADKNGDTLSKDLPGDKGTADVEAAQREISALKVSTHVSYLHLTRAHEVEDLVFRWETNFRTWNNT